MDGLNGATLQEVADLAHALAGSAGMFGEAQFGDEAYDLETAIRGALENSLSGNAHDRINEAYQRTVSAA